MMQTVLPLDSSCEDLEVCGTIQYQIWECDLVTLSMRMRLSYTVQYGNETVTPFNMGMRLSYTVQYGNETHQSCSQLYSRLIPRCLSWMSLYQKHSCAEHQHTNQHTCDCQSKNQPVNHLAVCLNTSHGFNYVLAYLLPLAHTHTHGHAHFYTVISPAESALKYQPYAVPRSPGLSTIQVNSTLVEQNTPPVTATFGGSTPPVSSSPAPDRRITGGEHSITPSDM